MRTRDRTRAPAALVLAAVFATVPPAGRLEARERTAHTACHTEEVPLDQGYGVSRVAERRGCDDLGRPAEGIIGTTQPPGSTGRFFVSTRAR